MKIRYVVTVVAAMSLSSAAYSADSGEELFNNSKCNSCHKLDKRTVGPSVKEIAEKYAGNSDAQAMLEKKVRNGGGSVWGKMPMPKTKDSVSDADIKTMVEWALSHK